MKLRPTRANRNQSKSLIYDQKNKLTVPALSFKAQKSNAVTTRSHVNSKPSPVLSTQTSTILAPCSKRKSITQKTKADLNLFSNSEEETNLEDEQYSILSPKKEIGWKGMVKCYREQISNYLQKRQIQLNCSREYVSHRHVLSPDLRIHILKHLFKIYIRFDLLRVTLHLAVHYFDSYLSKKVTLDSPVQAVYIAQACMFIAMKFEEIYPPDLNDWVERKNRQTIIKMQAKVLQTLNFQLSGYTVQHYVQMIEWQQGVEQSSDCSQMNLLLDLSLFDLTIRNICPSKLALSIFELSRRQTPTHKDIELNVKWMIQRNYLALGLLKSLKYSQITSSNIQ